MDDLTAVSDTSSALPAESVDMDVLLAQLIERTLSLGADHADARITTDIACGVDIRQGRIESIGRDEGIAVSLRALIGKRQAHVSGSDISQTGLEALARRCKAMAAAAPEDPWCALAEPDQLVSDPVELGLDADDFPGIAALTEMARQAEAAALAAGPEIRQCDHTGASWQRSRTHVAASNGFTGRRSGCLSSLAVAAIAERDGKMQRDYEARSARRFADLPDAAKVGSTAAQRTLRRLGAIRTDSRTAPVIFDNRLSASLLSALIGAISGPAVARGVSFLKDGLGQKVFASGVTVRDEPLRVGGFGSRSFDGEGHQVRTTDVIDDGVLTTWVLSGPSARQLGLEANGFSSMGFGDPPGVSVSNFDLLPGRASQAELMAEAKEGLLMTDMFGPSINANTGDYSVGVSGFWFSGGEIAFPVEEVTVAGDLLSMFSRAVPGSDLEIRSGVNAPSLLIDGMALGGA